MRSYVLNSAFVVGLLGSILYGALRFRRERQTPILERIALALMPAGFIVILGIIGQNFLEAAWQSWNNTRLLPAYMLADHIPLYFPKDSGPVLDMAYGPMNALSYLPVTWMTRTAEYASVVAKGLTLFYFYAPVVWLILKPHRDNRSSIIWALTALIAFWFYSLESSVLGNVALSNHADAPAICLGMFGFILFLEGERHNHWLMLLASALSLNLALWTKQVTLPLIVAVPLFALLSEGWRSALRISVLIIGVGTLLAVAIFHHWGYSAVVFNLITNPAHQPWEDRLIKINGHAIIELWQECRWLVLGFGTYLIYEFVYCGPYPSTRREWFLRNRWNLFAIGGLLLIPTSLIGRFKMGGALNELCFTVYFLAVSVLMVVIKVITHPVDSLERRLMQNILQGGLCFYVFSSVVLQMPAVTYYYAHLAKEIDDWKNPPVRAAVEFVRKHPDEAYLPWGMLSTYLAIGKIYHFDYALYDRDIAGFPLTKEHLWANLPAHMTMIAFSPRSQDQYVMRYFPEYSKKISVPELPEWTIYTKP